MRNVTVIARRELAGVFTSPLAYIVGAGYLVLVGVVFAMNFAPGKEASLRGLFDTMIYALVLAVPLLTMPLLTEEFSRGTIETMMTAPVTEVDLVLGKFLGVFSFYVVLLAATLVHMGIVMAHGEPAMGQALMGYLGMVLLGAAFIGVGVFFSSITRHQLLAALMSAVVLAAASILPDMVIRHATGFWHTLLSYVTVPGNFASASKGIFDSRSLVYFLSVTAFFLFVTVKVVESRRWR